MGGFSNRMIIFGTGDLVICDDDCACQGDHPDFTESKQSYVGIHGQFYIRELAGTREVLGCVHRSREEHLRDHRRGTLKSLFLFVRSRTILGRIATKSSK